MDKETFNGLFLCTGNSALEKRNKLALQTELDRIGREQ